MAADKYARLFLTPPAQLCAVVAEACAVLARLLGWPDATAETAAGSQGRATGGGS